MSRISQFDKAAPYVMDCISYKLTEREAIQYIKSRGFSVGPATYNRWKKKAVNDESLNKFFTHHARIGFIENFRKEIHEVEKIQEQLMRLYVEETSKTSTIIDPKDTRDVSNEQKLRIKNKDKDKYLIMKLAQTMLDYNKRHEELSLSNPTIAAVKRKIDLADKYPMVKSMLESNAP